MIFTKFHENRLIIEGEINEKHALLVECGPAPGYRPSLPTELYSPSN